MIVPTYHVVLRAGPADAFTVAPFSGAHVVNILMDGAQGPDEWRLDSSVWEQLAEANVDPGQTATDFFRFATAAYCADLLIPHRTAFDRWSRDIVLYVPVAKVGRWRAAERELQELLGFLTGDHWRLVFRAQHVAPPPVDDRRRGQRDPLSATRVSLLSGGLDSAIGAVDLLRGGHRVAFVSHNAKSGGAVFSSPSQQAVCSALAQEFGWDNMQHFRFRMNPPARVPGVTESVTTTRSRSIMFFALGLLVASGLDAANGSGPVPLVVPENGLISLNVPLTWARLGSWSTRTTHPHTLATLRTALAHLGIATPLQTPYATSTKGEMLADCLRRGRALVKKVTAATVSCAHPNQSRFLPVERRKPHCGTCVPCIIRRAATQHAGVDGGEYGFDLPREIRILQRRRSADARAFIFALERRHRPTRPLDLNVSGPLHVESDEELRALLRVYDAGMDEVARHLGMATR